MNLCWQTHRKKSSSDSREFRFDVIVIIVIIPTNACLKVDKKRPKDEWGSKRLWIALIFNWFTKLIHDFMRTFCTRLMHTFVCLQSFLVCNEINFVINFEMMKIVFCTLLITMVVTLIFHFQQSRVRLLIIIIFISMKTKRWITAQITQTSQWDFLWILESVIGGWWTRGIRRSKWKKKRENCEALTQVAPKNQWQNQIDWETRYITIFNSYFRKALKTMSDEPWMRYFQVNPKRRWTLNIAGGKIKFNLCIVVTIQLRWFETFHTRIAKWKISVSFNGSILY